MFTTTVLYIRVFLACIGIPMLLLVTKLILLISRGNLSIDTICKTISDSADVCTWLLVIFTFCILVSRNIRRLDHLIDKIYLIPIIE